MPPAILANADQLLGTSLRTAVAYVVVLALIRLAGRRTLAQMSAFDIVVTIATGTIVGSSALPSSPTVSDGVVAIATLFLLQVLVGALRQRFGTVRRLLDFRPQAVIVQGEPSLRYSPTSAQLTRDELATQLRQQGVSRLRDVRLAVLEPTGGVSVLRLDDEPPDQPGDLFAEVRRPQS